MDLRGRLISLCAALSLVLTALAATQAAAAEYQIHGFVRSPAGDPREFFRVDAYKLDSSTGTWTLRATDSPTANSGMSTGSYQMWVSPGTYRLKVRWCLNAANDNGGNCLASPVEFYGADTFEHASDIVVTDATRYADLVLHDPRAHLFGTLTGPDGPVGGALVLVDTPSDRHDSAKEASTTTDASGRWDVLAYPGNRRIRYVPADGSGLSMAFWGDAADAGDAQLLPVHPGAELGGLDGVVKRRGTIAGSVRDPDGDPAQLTVLAQRVDEEGFTRVRTGTDGRFSIAADADASYRLYFQQTSSGPISYWPSTATEADGQTISVSEGSVVDVAQQHPARAPQGAVTGRLTDEAGEPLSGIRVEATSAASATGERRTATSDADGRFGMNLPPGDYTFCFTDAQPDPTYAAECWDDAHHRPATDWEGNYSTSGLRLVTVEDGQSTSDVSATLSRSGVLEGTLVLQDADRTRATVTAYRFDDASGRWRAAAETGLTGSGSRFRLALLPGRYRLRATYGAPGTVLFGPARYATWWVEQRWWPSATDVGSATDLVVSPRLTTVADLTLPDQGDPETSITGTVLDADRGDHRLVAVRLDERCVPFAPDDPSALVADGVAVGESRVVPGLPDGRYRVYFPGGGTDVLDHTWWPSAVDYRSAEDVFVRGGRTAGGINGFLRPQTRLSGRVTSATGAPLRGATVDLEVHNTETGRWSAVKSTLTFGDGTYSFSDIFGGEYRVTARGGPSLPAQGDGAWNSTGNASFAEPFIVSSAAPAPVLDDVRLDDLLPATSSITAPVIGGEPVVGERLRADEGQWAPAVRSVAYQWNRDGRPISNATQPVYALSGPDIGHEVSVTVSAYGRARTPGAVVVSAGVVADDDTLTHLSDEPTSLDVVRPAPVPSGAPTCGPTPTDPPAPAGTPTPTPPTPGTTTGADPQDQLRQGRLTARSPRTDTILVHNREDLTAWVHVAGRAVRVGAGARRVITTTRDRVRWRATWIGGDYLRLRGRLRVR